jgi:glycerate kinase
MLPMTDGGDGTLDVLPSVAHWSRVEGHQICGPLGRPVRACLGRMDESAAVVDVGEAAGLRRVGGRLRPL